MERDILVSYASTQRTSYAFALENCDTGHVRELQAVGPARKSTCVSQRVRYSSWRLAFEPGWRLVDHDAVVSYKVRSTFGVEESRHSLTWVTSAPENASAAEAAAEAEDSHAHLNGPGLFEMD